MMTMMMTIRIVVTVVFVLNDTMMGWWWWCEVSIVRVLWDDVSQWRYRYGNTMILWMMDDDTTTTTAMMMMMMSKSKHVPLVHTDDLANDTTSSWWWWWWPLLRWRFVLWTTHTTYHNYGCDSQRSIVVATFHTFTGAVAVAVRRNIYIYIYIYIYILYKCTGRMRVGCCCGRRCQYDVTHSLYSLHATWIAHLPLYPTSSS